MAASEANVVPNGTYPDILQTAVDDPAIKPDRNGYRSFYVSDAVFARFRAAVHWTSRRPEIADRVHDNMSVAVEEFMRETAARLESEFNDGKFFPPTPKQVRRVRKPRG